MHRFAGTAAEFWRLTLDAIQISTDRIKKAIDPITAIAAI